MLRRRNLKAIGAVGVIYGRFPSVDQCSRFAGVPNLSKPLYREKTVARGPHRRDVTHILSKVSCC